MGIPQTDCRFFNGYKPCGLNSQCNSSCTHFQKRGSQILLIHLGALGAVVRSTALLASIHRKYSNAQITWVTDAPAHKILQGHPDIHRVLTTQEADLLELSALKFDVALIVDKSVKATGVLRRTQADLILGFVASQHGAILPANQAAHELWSLGLDNNKKFYVNQKTEIELVAEALELDFQKDDYNLPLTQKEKDLQFQRWNEWSYQGRKTVVGINTGCATTLPAKKLSVENHRELIRRLESYHDIQIVLLGGPEDTERNLQIGQGNSCLQSPTQLGLRDGLVSVAACDVVISGDSLGLHMAISQKKRVIAWFGPTCAHEIELYGRGKKVLTQAPCSPCWKRSCQKPVMCYDLVETDDITYALRQQISIIRQGENELGSADRISGGFAFDSSSIEMD